MPMRSLMLLALLLCFPLTNSYCARRSHAIKSPWHYKARAMTKFKRNSQAAFKISKTTIVKNANKCAAKETLAAAHAIELKDIAFVGAGFNAGQPTSGVAKGPMALCDAGLADAIKLLGKSFSQTHLEFPTADLFCVCPDAGLHRVKDAVAAAATAGSFALTVGGDHSIASASIAGLAQRWPDLAVVWIDAHADANTPLTSPSGNYHGMPAAHVMGWFEETPEGFEWLPKEGVIAESNLAYIGLRDIDPAEAKMLRASQASIFTMHDVERLGIATVVDRALAAIDPFGTRAIHLSLDIDAVDPLYAPAVGTAASGGLTPREVKYVCTELGRTKRLVGMDLVEVNPDLDPSSDDSKMHGDNPALAAGLSPTVKLAAECVLAALDDSLDTMR